MNPRLDALLNRWIDGDLSEPEAEALQRLLADDPEARRACYELLLVERMLTENPAGLDLAAAVHPAAHPTPPSRSLRSKRLWLGLAAAAVAVLAALPFLPTRQGPGQTPAMLPVITGSMDSRITIAQRQDTSGWAVGELLRLERGSADVSLGHQRTLRLDGPAAVERLDPQGSIRLLEGMASLEVAATGKPAEIRLPGGDLHSRKARAVVEVAPNGRSHIRVQDGQIEIHPRGGISPLKLREGESLALDPDGSHRNMLLQEPRYRAHLPRQIALFRDDFKAGDETLLSEHSPSVGGPWTILSELNPTRIRKQRLDTSGGARRIVAPLEAHGPQGSRAVYIFSFDLHPPEWIHDKINRQGGIEHITLLDAEGNEIVSLVARATNGHRWQLADETTKATSALTPASALWTHSLTLCYGLNGLVTLHDGRSAQAPVIAEMRIQQAAPATHLLIRNFDGGDLALSRIEAILLPDPLRDDL